MSKKLILVLSLFFSVQAFTKPNLKEDLVKPARLHKASLTRHQQACIDHTTSLLTEMVCMADTKIKEEVIEACAIKSSNGVSEALCLKANDVRYVELCFLSVTNIPTQQLCYATHGFQIQIDESMLEEVFEAIVGFPLVPHEIGGHVFDTKNIDMKALIEQNYTYKQ